MIAFMDETFCSVCFKLSSFTCNVYCVMILALANAADEHVFESVDFKLRVVCLLFSLVAT